MTKPSVFSVSDEVVGKYKLFIDKPITPQDDFMNDIFISLQQMKAGDVGDLETCLCQLREELGLDDNECHSDTAIPIGA